MNCPACGAKLDNTDQKYCEFCGYELINITSTSKEQENVKFSSNRSRRRCC